MAKIGDSKVDLKEMQREVMRDRKGADQQIRDLIKDIQKDRVRAVDLARVDIKDASPGTKLMLAQLLAQQLRGQIPAGLAKSLMSGNASLDMLDQLMQRLGNASSSDLANRFGRAQNSAAARDSATDRSVPQQALRWTQFVQKAQHVPGAKIQTRAGVASPKGEGTSLLELLGTRLGGRVGPGLRSPQLVERSLADLSPGQRAFLMRATFGEKLASELMRLGITDPLQFVRAGALPAARETLSRQLNIPRARLLGLLMRAELLKIGPGRNGELGIRPEILGPLRESGIVMLGSLVVLRSLSRKEMAHIYRLLRKAAGGFARAIKGGRPVVKRDLLHWSRAASRRPSEILLADSENRQGGLRQADAQELIQSWYMENLLWEQLAYARRYQDELEQAVRQRIQREEREEKERRDQRGDDENRDEPEWFDDLDSEFEFDENRMDNLMCFWITDFNADLSRPGSMRRMYVCIDPKTGAIIPQSIEEMHSPS